jgi:hypothetical protein
LRALARSAPESKIRRIEKFFLRSKHRARVLAPRAALLRALARSASVTCEDRRARSAAEALWQFHGLLALLVGEQVEFDFPKFPEISHWRKRTLGELMARPGVAGRRVWEGGK